MSKKIINIVICLALFGLGVFKLVYNLQQNGYGLFYLVSFGNEDHLVYNKSGELLKGDKILGKFFSKNPNLGTVSVRFTNHNRDSRDTLVFRLKENGTDNWFYKANYNTDQFKPGQLFPFGFPIIKDSANKTYIFELESLAGATGSGIYLDREEPSFSAISFFDRHELLQNFRTSLNFLINKIINIFGTRADIYLLLVYFSPLILYFSYLLSEKISYQFLPGIIFIFFLFDLLFLSKSYDYYLISVGILWLLAVIRFKFDSRISSFAALALLIFVPVLGIAGLKTFADKVANWSYLFLTFAVLQQVYEFKFPNQKLFTPSEFLRNFTDFTISTPLVKNLYYLTLISTTGWLIYATFSKITHGLHLYREFFPDVAINPSMAAYIFFVGTVLIMGSWLIFRYFKIFFDNKTLFILLWILLHLSVSLITANMTQFEHVPKIFTISPTVTSEAWTDVTINGRNFQDLPFVGKINLNGLEQGEYLISWSDRKVVFRTSPTLSKSGQLCLQTVSKGSSNCVNFEYNFGKNKND